MDRQIKEQKIKLWKKQEEELKKQLVETYQRKGAAAQEGDLKENAAYQMAIEESEVITVRLRSIQQMIADLEKSDFATDFSEATSVKRATSDKGEE